MNIEIDLPEGTRFEKAEVVNGKVVITTAKKQLTVFEKYDTVDKVLAHFGLPSEKVFDETHLRDGLTLDEIAYKKLKLIVKALNEDWVADFDDPEQMRYSPYFYCSSGFQFYGVADWSAFSYVGSRLVLKSMGLAKFAGKTFTHVYKAFMVPTA